VRNVPKGELGRKAIHYTALLIPLIYYLFIEKEQAIWILIVLSTGMLMADLLRINVPFFKALYNRYFGEITRPHEHQKHLTGATYLFLGSLLVVSLFSKEIAVIAMFFLTVGDPSACMIGISFGRIKIMRNKTLEGSVAFILAGLAATWWIPGISLHVKILGVCAASLIELLPWRLDDNITIPLFSALLMYYLI